MSDPQIVIVRATADDLDLAKQAIAEVNLSTSHYTGQLDNRALSDFLANPKNYLLLAVCEKRVTGSLYGYALQQPYRRQPQFFLYAIDVRPEFRGRGIGAALVRHFISEARNATASEVWVITSDSNQAAGRMYATCGLASSASDDVMLSLEL